MSTRAMQTAPSRCSHCQVNEEVSLNDIANIVTALNLKTLLLRNEVNAFKSAEVNGVKKLSAESRNVIEPLFSRWNDGAPAIYPKTLELDRLIISEVTEPRTIRDKSINGYKFKLEEGNNEVMNTMKLEELRRNFECQHKIKENAYCNSVYDKPLKIGKKRISRKAQCNLPMDCKRRSFLNCFKRKSHNDGYKSLKLNKPPKTSLKTNVRVTFDPQVEEMGLSKEKGRNEENMFKNMQQENYGCTVDERDEIIHRICKSVEIESEKGKEAVNQFICSNELCKLESQGVLQKDATNEENIFKTGRMGGGAECHGSRLISNINDKMHKLNLYMNVKFDAKNVKRRLDACIAELNGIIEDVSLIFPDTDISEEARN